MDGQRVDKAGAPGRPGGRDRGAGAAALREPGRREARPCAESLPGQGRPGGSAWTSAPPRADSRTACSSGAPRGCTPWTSARPARRRPAAGSARRRDGEHERAPLDPRSFGDAADARRRRRLLHLAREGPARRLRRPRAARRGGRAGQAAVRGRHGSSSARAAWCASPPIIEAVDAARLGPVRRPAWLARAGRHGFAAAGPEGQSRVLPAPLDARPHRRPTSSRSSSRSVEAPA